MDRKDRVGDRWKSRRKSQLITVKFVGYIDSKKVLSTKQKLNEINISIAKSSGALQIATLKNVKKQIQF